MTYIDMLEDGLVLNEGVVLRTKIALRGQLFKFNLMDGFFSNLILVHRTPTMELNQGETIFHLMLCAVVEVILLCDDICRR